MRSSWGFGRGVVGLELGRTVAAVRVRGDRLGIVGAGRSAHGGLEGDALGRWLRRWLEASDCSARTAHVVLADGHAAHHVVTMPEMPASRRHAVADAEVRRLTTVAEPHLAYGHRGVGTLRGHGARRQRVLLATLDRDVVQRAVDVVRSAGLEPGIVTTVPMALTRAHEMLPPASGGSAIAYLASGRSYVVAYRNGALGRVHDFVLPDTDGSDPQSLAAHVVTELAGVPGADDQSAGDVSLERLVLTGPLAGLYDVATHLRAALGIEVRLFDASSEVDLERVSSLDQPALAAALGAAKLGSPELGNVMPADAIRDVRARRVFTVGRWVAAAVLASMLVLGTQASLDGSTDRTRLASLQERVAARRVELEQVRVRSRERAAHAQRARLVDQRALESILVGGVLQRIAQEVPAEMALESLEIEPVAAPGGITYWDVELRGLVLGASRSESQAAFNRFYARMAADPLIQAVRLPEGLVVGVEPARGPAPVEQESEGDAAPVRPGRDAPARPLSAGARARLAALPPFAPSPTSVAFTVVLQLKAIGTEDVR